MRGSEMESRWSGPRWPSSTNCKITFHYHLDKRLLKHAAMFWYQTNFTQSKPACMSHVTMDSTDFIALIWHNGRIQFETCPFSMRKREKKRKSQLVSILNFCFFFLFNFLFFFRENGNYTFSTKTMDICSVFLRRKMKEEHFNLITSSTIAYKLESKKFHLSGNGQSEQFPELSKSQWILVVCIISIKVARFDGKNLTN